MKQTKISSIGRQKKALAFICICVFSSDKIVVNFYLCIDKGETKTRKKNVREKTSGPSSSSTNWLRSSRVLLRIGTEDAALPLQAGTKPPLLILLLHGHLLVLPASLSGQGTAEEAPQNHRVCLVHEEETFLVGNKNIRNRLNCVFDTPVSHLLSAFWPCLRESL